MTAISIVIVNYNTVDYLHECLNAVYQFTFPTPEVIVVDNASSDDSCEMVKRDFPQVNLIASKENLGFGVGNNLGVAQAKNPFVMLLNSDAILTVNTAQSLKEYLENNDDVSCVGPRVVLPNSGEIQAKAFGYVPKASNILMQSVGLNRLFPKCPIFAGVDGDYRWTKEMQVGWISGVCMMMRTQDFLKVGGFDARFFMYCEDIDLCIKLSSHGRIVIFDDYDVIHYGGASSKSMASKIRNSLWQQQNMLAITQKYYGTTQALLARVFIALGLILRLCTSILLTPKNGVRENETLLSSWARLKDIIGLTPLEKVIK